MPDSASDPLDKNTFERMARTVRYITQHYQEQPSLEALAGVAHLSPHHFQRTFTRWAGISPKKFVAHMTLDQAKMSLIRNSNVLSAALDAGLSGPSRLHDLSVTFEAMTPGQMKARGKGLTIKYGASPSPLGLCIVCATEKGVCGLAFAWPEDKDKTINKMIGRWPHAAFKQDDDLAFKVTRMIFNDKTHPIALHAMGTNFQVQVWKALLSIPFGQTATYKIIAENVCTAKASRAVGAANAANPISLLIPCHRVIRESGALAGYAWGEDRKRALLAWESARAAEAASFHDSIK